MLHNVNRILHSYLESGENPEQAYPYCNADEGSKENNPATGSRNLGRRCPRKMLSQDTNSAETMLWEGAHGFIFIFVFIS